MLNTVAPHVLREKPVFRPALFVPLVLPFLIGAPAARSVQPELPVLYIGVRSLPESMSPALAFTLPERQVLDLIFERLVEPVEDPQGVQHYRPQLAERMPRVAPLERDFRIRAGAKWPDGSPVTALDVREMVQRLLKRDWVGRSPLWQELNDVRVGGDPARVRLTFKNGQFEPLTPMSFPVLPQHFRKKPLRLDDEQFAREPFGSGPYQVDPQRVKEDGREYLVLRPNPHYERDGRKPAFAEIRLFAAKNGAKEFARANPMHVWLDAPAGAIEGAKVQTLASNRVYCLAVNHRHTPLADVKLRRAIAHAINRKAILKKHFGVSEPDAALNGPYPKQSWASSSEVLALNNPQLARSNLGENEVTLSLKYPDDDSRVAAACTEIQAQLGKLATQKGVGIHLKLVPLSPRQLKKDVDDRDYELAYFHLDYPDDTFPLWPYFDQAEKDRGGANFLGYGDADLLNRLSRLRSARNFKTVREVAQSTHLAFFEQLPFIPLWRLPTHVAFRGIDPGRLDGRRVFANVERWRLTP